jgi:hypothetical protein
MRFAKSTKPIRRRCRLGVEPLEDRATPTVSTVVSNFNGTAIPQNDTVWFNSVAKVSGLTTGTETLFVKNAQVTFTSNGTPYSVGLPDMTLTLTTLATSASTSYDSNGWHVTAPQSFSGNVFLGGAALPLPGGLPGGIKNVNWSGNFTSDTSGMSVNWQWAAAVYTTFGSSPGSFGIKTVDDNHKDAAYANSDHAGTPEAFKQYVTGGATGGGGSNYTGSYSGTASVTPEVGMNPPPTSNNPGANNITLSGKVYVINNGSPVSGVEIDLLDGNGITVKSTVTGSDGTYSFTGVSAGTYTVHEGAIDSNSYYYWGAFAGTVNNATDGQFVDLQNIGSVSLVNGNAGINYDFALGLVVVNPT